MGVSLRRAGWSRSPLYGRRRPRGSPILRDNRRPRRKINRDSATSCGSPARSIGASRRVGMEEGRHGLLPGSRWATAPAARRSGDEAAVVGAEELLQHRAGQEPGPGELLRAELVPCAGRAWRAASKATRETRRGDLPAVTSHDPSRDGRRFTGLLPSNPARKMVAAGDVAPCRPRKPINSGNGRTCRGLPSGRGCRRPVPASARSTRRSAS